MVIVPSSFLVVSITFREAYLGNDGARCSPNGVLSLEQKTIEFLVGDSIVFLDMRHLRTVQRGEI